VELPAPSEDAPGTQPETPFEAEHAVASESSVPAPRRPSR
jgi:hypothetical protein